MLGGLRQRSTETIANFRAWQITQSDEVSLKTPQKLWPWNTTNKLVEKGAAVGWQNGFCKVGNACMLRTHLTQSWDSMCIFWGGSQLSLAPNRRAVIQEELLTGFHQHINTYRLELWMCLSLSKHQYWKLIKCYQLPVFNRWSTTSGQGGQEPATKDKHMHIHTCARLPQPAPFQFLDIATEQ